MDTYFCKTVFNLPQEAIAVTQAGECEDLIYSKADSNKEVGGKEVIVPGSHGWLKWKK